MKTLDETLEELYEKYRKRHTLKELGKDIVSSIAKAVQKQESVEAALPVMTEAMGEYELIRTPETHEEAEHTAKREVLYSNVCNGLHKHFSYITAKNIWSTYIGNE